MRVYNRYLLVLAISFCLITILMALQQVESITAYFSVYAIIYLGLTALFVHLNPRAKRGLDAVSLVISAAFIAIVILRAVEALRA